MNTAFANNTIPEDFDPDDFVPPGMNYNYQQPPIPNNQYYQKPHQHAGQQGADNQISVIDDKSSIKSAGLRETSLSSQLTAGNRRHRPPTIIASSNGGIGSGSRSPSIASFGTSSSNYYENYGANGGVGGAGTGGGYDGNSIYGGFAPPPNHPQVNGNRRSIRPSTSSMSVGSGNYAPQQQQQQQQQQNGGYTIRSPQPPRFPIKPQYYQQQQSMSNPQLAYSQQQQQQQYQSQRMVYQQNHSQPALAVNSSSISLDSAVTHNHLSISGIGKYSNENGGKHNGELPITPESIDNSEITIDYDDSSLGGGKAELNNKILELEKKLHEKEQELQLKDNIIATKEKQLKLREEKLSNKDKQIELINKKLNSLNNENKNNIDFKFKDISNLNEDEAKDELTKVLKQNDELYKKIISLSQKNDEKNTEIEEFKIILKEKEQELDKLIKNKERMEQQQNYMSNTRNGSFNNISSILFNVNDSESDNTKSIKDLSNEELFKQEFNNLIEILNNTQEYYENKISILQEKITENKKLIKDLSFSKTISNGSNENNKKFIHNNGLRFIEIVPPKFETGLTAIE
ncbi:hypothetical protein PACTADRAFT_84566 [Pachysolen tannophilus NRRL Y-2460]|uniref:Uncharacterized protein n=1 Tax=Pachysolen tannophilus NRRL Y-2460 TaxID=669874 RepID=A0A1E4U0E0_PACTA|nr:hypothetical protein PACTADRAFT_84566 [Pachysolen tannophilus NRRL Y-2460]